MPWTWTYSQAYEDYLDRLIDGLHLVVAQTAESGDEAMSSTVMQATQAILVLRHARDLASGVTRQQQVNVE